MDYKKKYLKYKAKYLNIKKQIKGGWFNLTADDGHLAQGQNPQTFLGLVRNTTWDLTEYAGESVAGAANTTYNTTAGVVNYAGESVTGAVKSTYKSLVGKSPKRRGKPTIARG